MHLLGLEVISISNIPTDGLRRVNKGSAPNVLKISLWSSCSTLASTCNVENSMYCYVDAVNVSASPGGNLMLIRLDIMTAGLRR